MKLADTSSCCGCGACSNICAKKAIQMQSDEEGFLYPVVNEDLCVDCGLCVSVCPASTDKEILRQPISSYAAWNKDENVRFESSSGGMFSVIAENILDRGGVVYGAAWKDGLKLSHVGVERKEQLGSLRGSKYIQSDMGNCYSEIRNHLRQDRWVCFCGTPCQVAALQLFLRKEYDKLVTVDFVCHGVPSQKVFDAFLSDVEKRRGVRLDRYNFRDKRVNGWSVSTTSSGLVMGSGKRKDIMYDIAMSSYMKAFLLGKMSRTSCYSCAFSQKKRCSDFTLGDYWGVRNVFPQMQDVAKGVSMLFVNTEKAHSFMDQIAEKSELIKSSVDEIAAYNANLNQPTHRPQSRNNLKSLFLGQDYIKENIPSTYNRDMLKFYIKRLLRFYK